MTGILGASVETKHGLVVSGTPWSPRCLDDSLSRIANNTTDSPGSITDTCGSTMCFSLLQPKTFYAIVTKPI